MIKIKVLLLEEGRRRKKLKIFDRFSVLKNDIENQIFAIFSVNFGKRYEKKVKINGQSRTLVWIGSQKCKAWTDSTNKLARSKKDFWEIQDWL